MVPVPAVFPLRWCPACPAGPFADMDELAAHATAMADPLNREPADGDRLLGIPLEVTDGGGVPHIENRSHPRTGGAAMTRLNPETLSIEGLDRKVFTAAQFDQIERPPCLVCGTPVTIARIDITMNEADLIENGRSYIPGTWECPRGCNPRTGQRFHSSQTFGSSLAGAYFECSCGTKETGVTGDEFKALAERHPLGKYT